jgi:hypothetical protein
MRLARSLYADAHIKPPALPLDAPWFGHELQVPDVDLLVPLVPRPLAEALHAQRLCLGGQMSLPRRPIQEKLAQFRVLGLVGIRDVLLTGVCAAAVAVCWWLVIVGPPSYALQSMPTPRVCGSGPRWVLAVQGEQFLCQTRQETTRVERSRGCLPAQPQRGSGGGPIGSAHSESTRLKLRTIAFISIAQFIAVGRSAHIGRTQLIVICSAVKTYGELP